MKVLGINGSPRNTGNTATLVQNVLEGAQRQGATVELLNVSDYTLPFADGRLNNDDSYGPVVQSLRKKVAEADALVIGTPEYHGGYSGSLKNFLDLNCIQNFKNKWVALVGAAGGRMGAESALTQLRTVMAKLEAFTLPLQTSVGKLDLDAQGKVSNELVLQRLKNMGQDLVKQAQKQKTATTQAS